MRNRVGGRYHGQRSVFDIFDMQRRDFLKIAGLAAAGSRLGGQQPQSFLAPAASKDVAATDFTLRISPVTVDLPPNPLITPLRHNATSPGPLFRLKQPLPPTLTVAT